MRFCLRQSIQHANPQRLVTFLALTSFFTAGTLAFCDEPQSHCASRPELAARQSRRGVPTSRRQNTSFSSYLPLTKTSSIPRRSRRRNLAVRRFVRRPPMSLASALARQVSREPLMRAFARRKSLARREPACRSDERLSRRSAPRRMLAGFPSMHPSSEVETRQTLTAQHFL